jgi:hypothetical protein
MRNAGRAPEVAENTVEKAPSNHLGWTARVDVDWRGRRDSNPRARRASAMNFPVNSQRLSDPRAGKPRGPKNPLRYVLLSWSGKRGSNPRLPPWQDYSYLRLQPPSGSRSSDRQCDVRCDASGCKGGHTRAKPGRSEDRKRRARLHGVAPVIRGNGCGGWNRTTNLLERRDHETRVSTAFSRCLGSRQSDAPLRRRAGRRQPPDEFSRAGCAYLKLAPFLDGMALFGVGGSCRHLRVLA